MLARLVGLYERARCALIGHDLFDDRRFAFVWCADCGAKWRRPYVDAPLTWEGDQA